MKNYLNYLLVLLFIAGFIFYSGCESDPTSPPTDHPQELITTVILTLINQTNQDDTINVVWKDLDGEGGNPPEIDTLFLTSGVNYNGSIQLLDESKTPPEDITEEIEEEKNSHQIFYNVLGPAANRITITITDFDSNSPPLPVGLEFTFEVSAGDNTSGSLNIVLSHYDGQKTAEPSDESDIDIEFPVSIQ